MSAKSIPSKDIQKPLDGEVRRMFKHVPSDLTQVREDVCKKNEEIEQNVQSLRTEIQRGIRPAGKRFRL